MRSILLGLALAAVAGLAQAEIATPAVDGLLPVRSARPAIDLSTPHAGFAPRYADGRAARIPGVARTAVEHRFDPDGVVGSLGFLCGLKPGAERFGAAAARGYDPTGRFVGAKLSLAFR